METHSKTYLSAEHLNAASAQLNLPAGPAIVLANLAGRDPRRRKVEPAKSESVGSSLSKP